MRNGRFAFLEADALAKWLPPNGFACTVQHLEPKVGGTFKCSSGISRRAKAIRSEANMSSLPIEVTDQAYVEASELAHSRGLGIWGDAPP